MSSPSRPYDPLRLDVERFARDGARLAGAWSLAGMPRLVEACHADGPPGPEDIVAWDARGEIRRSNGESQTWLEMSLRTCLNLTCQRCLGAVPTPLAVESRFRFVDGEAQAAALDADAEEDVLASTRSLNLRMLAEDELLLALPIVPRHDVCPTPLPLPSAGPGDEAVVAPSPFAALAGLKKARH
jgi:uncharacterized protein